MEFRLEQDLSLIMAPQEIAFNYDQLKTELKAQLEKYQGLVVTEDGIADAKKDRATLRKVATAINDEKIRVKKQWMEPYTTFEDKCKELIALCEAPAKAIDEQIKAYEDAKKTAKRSDLESHFTENVGIAREYVTFEEVYDPKWLNATVAVETAKEQMEETLARYKDDVAALEAIEADPLAIWALKADYKRTKSIAHVLGLKAQIEQEARQRVACEAEQSENADAQNEAKSECSFSMPGTCPKIRSDERVELRFWVSATREQLTELRQFFKDNGIEYGKID